MNNLCVLRGVKQNGKAKFERFSLRFFLKDVLIQKEVSGSKCMMTKRLEMVLVGFLKLIFENGMAASGISRQGIKMNMIM